MCTNTDKCKQSLIHEVICCANCGDTCNEEGFSPPENCEWFCCVDCYEEYNDTGDL
jgi:hypothetical protein